MTTIVTLTEENLQTATHWLAARDPALARVYEQYGYPPLWARQPDFPTLIHIILEQQVSLQSANAAYNKLTTALDQQITPDRFLALDDTLLRDQVGFSRQKINYARGLATAVLDGTLDIARLHTLSDPEVKRELTQLKGIGDWTADIYLSECLLRPDILPRGDIAMLEAFKTLKCLDARPAHDQFEAGTDHWRPWRSVGTRMLWHFYLKERGR
jgi:DNA-3-methyladenine glycosylase II